MTNTAVKLDGAQIERIIIADPKDMEKNQFYQELLSGKFAAMVSEAAEGKQIAGSQEVYNIMKPLISQTDDIEQGWFIFLNTKNRIIAIEKLFSGTLTHSLISPRQIIKKALELKAACIIMVHNHPSGEPEPSDEDKKITSQLYMALKSCEISLHDHMIIGTANRYYSFADSGRIQACKDQYDRYIADI